MDNLITEKVNNILQKYTLMNDIEDVFKIYDNNNLSYHNREHILTMLKNYYNIYYNEEYPTLDEDILILAILFHDSVYMFEKGIANKYNESYSADLADTFINEKKHKDLVRELIEFTTYKENIKDYINRINSSIDYDYYYILMLLDFGHLIFNDKEYYNLIKLENAVRNEYQHFDDNIYRQGRYEVLSKIKEYISQNLDASFRIKKLYFIDIYISPIMKILNYIELKGKLNY